MHECPMAIGEPGSNYFGKKLLSVRCLHVMVGWFGTGRNYFGK